MAPSVQPDAVALSEYDGLGRVVEITPLGGSGTALAVRTSLGGRLVLKPAARAADVDLQSRCASLLAGAGIRQARILPCASGALVTTSGYYLQELLPGGAVLRPDPAQVDAVMGHVGLFHSVLARLPGGYEPDTDSVWALVADGDWLVSRLPGLLSQYGLADSELLGAVTALSGSQRALDSLARQVVHGDLGPDNVLMDGRAVVAVVDFTPYYESALFGAATALYWYHVYGRAHADVPRLLRSLELLGSARPWTADELALWPAALLREALRRLATPLALGTPQSPSLPARVAAVRAILDIVTLWVAEN
ncbi:MAG TPA: phosphotransferase [Streptosporangiaceae bacterium]|jgi:Ser/Thr protein kinase RdoA (MazF antagonist)|nr:phosphotransferase [Streptosporangiaceae bacterium]